MLNQLQYLRRILNCSIFIFKHQTNEMALSHTNCHQTSSVFPICEFYFYLLKKWLRIYFIATFHWRWDFEREKQITSLENIECGSRGSIMLSDIIALKVFKAICLSKTTKLLQLTLEHHHFLSNVLYRHSNSLILSLNSKYV